MYKIGFVCLMAGLAGCASNHDLSTGSNLLGGGYKQEEVGAGLFSIYARSNHAPWANYEAARTTWRNGAEKACGSADFDELAIKENERDTGLKTTAGVRYLVTERTGFAKCDSSKLTDAETNRIVKKAGGI